MQRDERNKQTAYILNLESNENKYFTEYIFGLFCSGSGIDNLAPPQLHFNLLFNLVITTFIEKGSKYIRV